VKKLFLFFILVSTAAMAQARTEYVDLSRRDTVPLYDCTILNGRYDQNLCFNLSRQSYYRFDNGDYAVNCQTFRNRYVQNDCYELASSLLYNPRAFRCNQYDVRDQNRCFAVKSAYSNGAFPRTIVRPSSVTTTTTTVYQDTRPTVVTSCQATNYDEAYRRWDDERRAVQSDRGTTNTIVGIGAILFGTILQGNNDEDVRNFGTGLAIGGAALATYGLVQIADSSQPLPHTVCSQNYLRETRIVMVERQQCETTRYMDRYSSRSYYEVRCQNDRFVTFEEFRPWHSGRVITVTQY
jgi:hypothetical protein